MNNLFINSAYFGLVLTLGTYMLGVWIKKKTGLAIMNATEAKCLFNGV